MHAMVVGLLALLLLSGCGGDPDARSGRYESIATMTATPEPLAEDESATPPGDEEPEPNVAGCGLSGLEAATVQIVDVGDALMVTWEGQPVAARGTTGYYVTVYDADGNGGQLGVKYLDGEQIAYFIADLGAGQVNLDGQPDQDRVRNALTARFPKNIGFLAGGNVVKWSAAYTHNGSDVGTCPEPPDSTLSFPG